MCVTFDKKLSFDDVLIIPKFGRKEKRLESLY